MNHRHKTPRAPTRNNPDPQPDPVNHPSSETNEIPDGSDPRVAYIRLTYDWSGSERINPDHWQPHLLAFHRNDLYQGLVRDIARYAHDKLELREPLVCQDLDESETAIAFQLALQNDDEVKQHAATFDASGTSRLRDLSDLWEGDARPELSFTLRRVEDEYRDVVGGARRVRVRPYHGGEPRSQYFLIGSVPTPLVEGEQEEDDDNGNDIEHERDERGKVEEQEKSEKDKEDENGEDDDKGDGDGASGTTSQILSDTMSRLFWKHKPGSDQDPVLVQVPAWRYMDSCICDIDTETVLKNDPPIPTEFEPSELQQELNEVQDAKRFSDLIPNFHMRRIAGTLKPHRFGLSEQLIYRFWDVDDAYPNVPILPEDARESVAVAVRFLQHLESPKQIGIKFAQTIEHELSGDYTYEGIEKLVREGLEGMGSAASLSNQPYEYGKNWHLDLWVMHQKHKVLHRFKPGRDIRQFFHIDVVDQWNPRLFLEAHIVPNAISTESVPCDLPTNQTESGISDDQVLVRVAYDMGKDRMLKEMHGKSQTLRLSKHRSFQTLFIHLAHFVTSALEHYAGESYDKLNRDGKESYMLLRPVLKDLCPVRRHVFTFGGGCVSRALTIDDLLSETQEASGVSLDIELQLVDLLRRPHATDPMVEIRSGAEKANKGGISQFYRIGSVPRTQTQTQSIPISDTYFWRFENSNSTTVRVPTWSIRNFDVCDPGVGRVVPNRDVRELFDGSTAAAPLYSSDMNQSVQNGTILPFTGGRLKYSFKTFGTARNCPTPANTLPSTGVSVAVRFVNHMQGPEANKLSFVGDLELFVENGGDLNSVLDAVTKELKSKNTKSRTKALFKYPLENQWDLQLWILPQIPGGRTLYRHESGAQALHSFLDQTEVSQGDTTLFMEVHLVPKRQAPDGAGKKTGRVTRTAQRTPFDEL